ncbi:LacI family DNA-binding transcriptional regulator [Kineococcus sp. SYSU DK006]|uniref:LacI family DNA-binding transcriptional regulator n=1 Tax=Kineococcus sp. SYSU DK006 TaxID=3383127 RepID=UPI003D7C51FD
MADPAPPRRRPRQRAGGPVTLDDVAREAGVSLATASRVLNGSTRVVGEALRERVTAAAERLDYSANAQAQAMARGRSNVVGLVVHDIADPYFSTIAAGVMARAAGSDVIVTLAVTGGDPWREVQHVAALRRQRVRAVLLAGSRWQDGASTSALRAELEAFRSGGGRVAAVTQDVLGVDTVLVDNRGAAGRLAAALVDAGYREFWLLPGPQELSTAAERTAGFRAGLQARGLVPQAVLDSSFTRDGAYAALARALREGPPPRTGGRRPVVLAANDVMAVGAMAAARDAGLRVPEDLAVAGFDDIPTLRDIAPALTTVRLPLADIGAAAFDLVESAEDGRVRHRHVDSEVLLRASTPAQPPGAEAEASA